MRLSTEKGAPFVKDIVLQGFVKDFAEQNGLAGQEELLLFEAFAASCILRRFHQSETQDLEDFLTGGEQDAGIDAAAILVNGHPASTQADVDFFLEKLRRLDVEFIFIQAKTSGAFNAGLIGTFVHGVIQFSTHSPTIPFHDELERLRTLKNFVYQKSINMQRNPRCCFYYVSTGSWEDAPEPRARLEDGKRRLEAMNLFSQVDAIPLDAERSRRFTENSREE